MHNTDGITHDRILKFKSSVAADIYSTTDIVDIETAIKKVDSFSDDIIAINKITKTGKIDSESIGSIFIEHPRVYRFLCALLTVTTKIEFQDGRTLPAPSNPPSSTEDAAEAAALLLELGIGSFLKEDVDIRSLMLFMLIANDAPKRRSRSEIKIKSNIKKLVDDAINDVTDELKYNLQLGSNQSLPESVRRIVEYVILVDSKPRIAVVSTFQAYSGGRQSREMRTLYPNIQATLSDVGMNLVLIADGQGMKRLSDRVLGELFKNVHYTLSLSQAEQGGLREAFSHLAAPPPEPTVDGPGLRKLIENALSHLGFIDSDSLPTGDKRARLALANYASSNSRLDLTLSSEGTGLSWSKLNLITTLRGLRNTFDDKIAIKAFLQLIGESGDAVWHSGTRLSSAILKIEDDPVFFGPLVVVASDRSLAPAAFREIGKHALHISPESRVSMLVTPGPISESALRELRDLQPYLPVTVIAVDIETCIATAQAREAPWARLKSLLLEQTDLTKVSPFVVRGVTPSRVFFGREEEEATLISTLPTHSIAILGGRRIGKTSLMTHLFDRLQNADLSPFFGDCQVVRTWSDFGSMASREWNIDVPDSFKPKHLFNLVKSLDDGSGRSIVILLDEIDQLLDWDKSHAASEVPEAFFRACRSISQKGFAQFVFSGERIIAQRMWDATSPHWNFCRPLMLLQLTAPAARSLMEEPLEALGVRIDDRDTFVSACWKVTDGHPELLQFVGDRLVQRINRRDRSDVFVTPDDVFEVSNKFEYAEQYLETYWGQSTVEERLLTLILVEGLKSFDNIMIELEKCIPHRDSFDVANALHMLALYGIAEQSEAGYQTRAHWFSTALGFYGGREDAMKRYIRELGGV